MLVRPAVLVLALACVATGCLERTASGVFERDLSSSKPRDPKAPGAAADRQAAAYYLAKLHHAAAPTGTPAYQAYVSGDCSAAPDVEARAFCEGRYKDLHDKNLLFLGYGSGSYECRKIEDADLRAYCDSTAYSYQRSCDEVTDPTLRSYCTANHEAKAPPPSGGAGGYYSGGGATEPAASEPAPAEPAQPACLPLGAYVVSADECCSGTAEFASDAPDDARAQGREEHCIE